MINIACGTAVRIHHGTTNCCSELGTREGQRAEEDWMNNFTDWTFVTVPDAH